jgi:regulator of sigma E protease
MEAYRGEAVTIIIGRGDSVKNLRATPRVNFPEGEGPLGIAIARLTVIRTPWYLAPFEGFRTLYRSVTVTVVGLYSVVRDLVIGKGAEVAVSGPVGIFFFAEDVRSLGTAYFIQFIGMLSVNLAILNLLPIPALDGGRIFFLAIEKIKGSKVNPQFENIAHTVGFVLLISLMLIVTYRDIVRIF